MNLLLAFSGSFLLGITCLHLLPETFVDFPKQTGVLLLVGFFIQLLIQRITHGIEHGHTHVHANSLGILPIVAGLSVHAFMEGLPLGFNYRSSATNPSLFLAVGAHKLPEAMILGVLLKQVYSRQKTLFYLLLFSLVTPVAGFLATVLGENYHAVSKIVMALIPIVAGAFIHIATTIFFESGTKTHSLTYTKVAAMLLGVLLAGLTLVLE